MANNLNGFFNEQKQVKKETPFDKQKKLVKDNAKPVKLNGELHRKLKIYTATNGGSMRDIIDKAVEEYMEKNNIK